MANSSKSTAVSDLISYYEAERDNLVKRVAGRFDTPHDGEDVVQEAFTRALKYWSSYKPDNRGVEFWFSRILRNAFCDAKNAERYGGMNTEAPEEEYYHLEIENPELDDAYKLIGSKPTHIREVLELSFRKGYKPREISQILDMSCGVVRTYLYNFRKEVYEGI